MRESAPLGLRFARRSCLLQLIIVIVTAMTISRILLFVTVVMGLSAGAAPRRDVALGLANLYFSAPLITAKMQESDSWKKHTALTGEDIEMLRPEIWESYRLNHRKAGAAFEQREIVLGEDRMPFTLVRRGSGRLPVTISLHGGGAIPKEQNDRQWQAQQQRYPDAPGIYVCPRAPRDTWNQWHAEHVYPLMEALMRDVLAHEEADPNRVYLMGYSAGGYGSMSMGANLADRFAAVAASAAAPTPHQTPVEHWRHLPLRFEIGEQDIAYGRVKSCREYQHILTGMQRQFREHFQFTFIEHENRGHQIDDQACASWLGQFERKARPHTVSWKPSNTRVRQFYWLANDEPAPGQEIEARIEGNRIQLETTRVTRLTVRLDDSLVDLDQPVTVEANGIKIFEGRVKREWQCLVKTLEERGDPELMFCSEIALYIPQGM